MIRISINRYCKVNNISQILFFFHKFNTGFPCQMLAVFILKTLPAMSIAILKLLFLTGHLVLLCFWSFLILQRKLNPAFSIHISPNFALACRYITLWEKFMSTRIKYKICSYIYCVWFKNITSKFVLILIARHSLMCREFCLKS